MRGSVSKSIAKIAILAALISVTSPLAIPLPSGVSLSLATMAIFIASAILPPLEAVIAVAVYLLLGFVGVPVFQGFTGGIQAFAGPSGGYLIAYPLGALASSLILLKERTFLKYFLAFLLGTLIIYVPGYLWFSFVTTGGITIQALIPSVLIFLPLDVVKALCAALISNKIFPLIK